MPKSTSIDMLSNSPVLVSYCSIIYILHWNIHNECHDCRHENKAEDTLDVNVFTVKPDQTDNMSLRGQMKVGSVK